MKLLAVDTETRGLDWFDPDENRAFMVTWSDAENDYFATEDDPESLAEFRAALDSADTLVFHNSKFDLHQIRETWGWDLIEEGFTIHDTDPLSRVLYPRGAGEEAAASHKLKALAKFHLGIDNDTEKAIEELAKSIGLRSLKDQKNKPAKQAYYKVWKAYPEAMAAYAMDDTRMTYDLFVYFMDRMDSWPDQRVRAVYELERQVLPVLYRAEQRGMALNRAQVTKLLKQYSSQLVHLHEELVTVFGAEAVDGDEDGKGQAKALLNAILGLGVPLYRKSKKTGVLETSKFAIQEFENEFPILKTLAEYRTVSLFIRTFLGPMERRSVIHPSIHQLGAWTSRMSCSRPNMQNIPRGADGVRSVIVPRKGYAFVVADYSSIEVRLLAYYLGDPTYRQRVKDEDPHAWMASKIHGGTVEEYLKGTPGQERRDKAKNTLFAISYGAGGPRISDMNQISIPEARALIKKVKGSLPGFYRLNKKIKEKIEATGYVNTMIGRKQTVNKDKSYVGLNAVIQGTAADIMKQGMVNADRAYAAAGIDATILMVVHDELIVEVTEHEAALCLRLTEDAMRAAADFEPGLEVEGKWTTKSYGAAK